MIQHAGEHGGTDPDFGRPERSLPAHLRPQQDQCVIRPAVSVYLCTQFGREEDRYEAQIPTSCGTDHSHNPVTQGMDLEEIPEHSRGWTVQDPSF